MEEGEKKDRKEDSRRHDKVQIGKLKIIFNNIDHVKTL